MKNPFKGSAEVVIKSNRQHVWKALVTPEIIKRYFYGTNLKTEWQVGGPIIFQGEYQGTSYEDKGTVMAFEPEKLIRYNYWSSMSGIEEKPENYMVLTYSLLEVEGGTKVTIGQENIPTAEMKEHSVENWKKVLAQLKMLVEDSDEVAAY